MCGAPGQTQSAWEALGWENCTNIMSPWAAHPTQVPFLLRHNGSQTMTVNNSLITHIPFYFWLEWKSTMFLRRPSWPSPEPWEQYSPDISAAHKMLTWVLRCAYNIHEGQEAHKLANLPLKKKKNRLGIGQTVVPLSLCRVSVILFVWCNQCFKTQRRPAPNEQHKLVTSS